MKVKRLLYLLGIVTADIVCITELKEGLSQRCFSILLKPLRTLGPPQKFILKVFNCLESYHKEKTILCLLEDSKITAKITKCLSRDNEHLILMENLQGITLAESSLSSEQKIKHSCSLMADFHLQTQEKLGNVKIEEISIITPLDFRLIFSDLLDSAQLASGSQKLIENFIERHLQLAIQEVASEERLVVCHGDFNFSNIILNRNIAKIIDFESVSLMPIEYDIAMMLAVNELTQSDIDKVCRYYIEHSHYGKIKSILLNKSLIEHYFNLAAIVNGLWYSSEYNKTDKNKYLLTKAKTQFSLVNSLEYVPDV